MTLQLMCPLLSRSQLTKTNVEGEELEWVPVATFLVVVGQEVEGVVKEATAKGTKATIIAVVMIRMVVIATMMMVAIMIVTMVVAVEVTIVMVDIVTQVMVMEDMGEVAMGVPATTPAVVVEEVGQGVGPGVLQEVVQGVDPEVVQEVDKEVGQEGHLEVVVVDQEERHVADEVVTLDVVLEEEADEGDLLGEEEVALVHRNASLVVTAAVVTKKRRGPTWITASRITGSRNSSGARTTAMVTRESSGIKTRIHSSSGIDHDPRLAAIQPNQPQLLIVVYKLVHFILF